MKKNKRNGENNSANMEGGIVAGGTEKERVISGEDAVSTQSNLCLFSIHNLTL